MTNGTTASDQNSQYTTKENYPHEQLEVTPAFYIKSYYRQWLKELSRDAISLLEYLMTYNPSYPSNILIKKDLRMGSDKFNECLVELLNKKYLTYKKGAFRKGCNKYTFLDKAKGIFKINKKIVTNEMKPDEGFNPKQPKPSSGSQIDQYLKENNNIVDSENNPENLKNECKQSLHDSSPLLKKWEYEEKVNALYKDVYPRKDGKKAGMEMLKEKINTEDEFEDFKKAVVRYADHCEVMKSEQKFIKLFKTFTQEFGEWVNDIPEKHKNHREKQEKRLCSNDIKAQADRVLSLIEKTAKKDLECKKSILGEYFIIYKGDHYENTAKIKGGDNRDFEFHLKTIKKEIIKYWENENFTMEKTIAEIDNMETMLSQYEREIAMIAEEAFSQYKESGNVFDTHEIKEWVRPKAKSNRWFNQENKEKRETEQLDELLKGIFGRKEAVG